MYIYSVVESSPALSKQLYSRRFYLYEAFTSAVTLAVNCVGSIKRGHAFVSSLPTFDIRLKPNFFRNKVLASCIFKDSYVLSRKFYHEAHESLIKHLIKAMMLFD